jgi:hypothetical protein
MISWKTLVRERSLDGQYCRESLPYRALPIAHLPLRGAVLSRVGTPRGGFVIITQRFLAGITPA